MTDENCIFCKIGKGEIPHNKVYEDDKYIAFLDIKPAMLGHVLLIPKKHVHWVHEAEDAEIEEIFKLAKKIILAMRKGLPCDFVQLNIIGRDVPHFHIHLVPRFMTDTLAGWPVKEYPEKNESEFVEKIKSGFN
ncbi:MAG: HIT domain-containing protein [Patescibacteria group bacterium]